MPLAREKYNWFIFAPFKGFCRKGEVHSKSSGRCKSELLLWIMWQAVSQTPGIWQSHQFLRPCT